MRKRRNPKEKSLGIALHTQGFFVDFCWKIGYFILGAANNGRRLTPFRRGSFFCPLILGKGGCPMVTYSDLIQLGILIVGIIGLFVQIKKK